MIQDENPPLPRQLLRSRIFYSTQSGRAKACSRRTARIINDTGTMVGQQQDTHYHPMVQLQNGQGTTFDDALLEFTKNPHAIDTTCIVSPSSTTSIIEQYVQHIRQSGTNLLLCFISTTGDGEHTDTIQKFWKLLLHKSLPNELFRDLSIAIFSLGDRCYGPDKYCAAGRKLMIRLRQLGATLLVPAGYGDDNTANGGIFIDLDHWLYDTLLPHLFPTTMDSNIHDNTISVYLNDTNDPNSYLSPTNSLYEVTIVSKIIDIDACPSLVEEWQQEKYREAYIEFFERQSPSNSYLYSVQQQQVIRRTNNRLLHYDDGDGSSMLLGRVVENRRLSAADWEQNTRHVRLDITTLMHCVYGSEANASGNDNESKVMTSLYEDPHWSLDKLPYQAGDVAVIMPSNTTEDVYNFLIVLPKYLQELADCELSIKYNYPADATLLYPGIGYMHWPTKCTFRGLLMHCGDIHALPEREDLRALAQYCSHRGDGKQQHNKLVSLSETKESALYVDYIIREKRSWVDVLYDFDSLRDEGSRLTIEAILGLLLPIRPRLFSIASSPTKDWIARNEKPLTRDEFSIELCVAVVEGTTRRGRKFHGLCSNYISGLNATDSNVPMKMIPLWIQPGSFHGLPLDFNVVETVSINESPDRSSIITPVLCIGAGTGVAPLRAIIHEREAVWQLNQCIPLQPYRNHNILLFGSRKKDSDFYYEQEWKLLEQSGQLHLLTAFSQDQWHKIYVQQVLESEKFGPDKIVKHLIDERGAIYIAGGPKMARAVNDVIVEALYKFDNNSDAKGPRKTLSKLQNLGLYCVEAWS